MIIDIWEIGINYLLETCTQIKFKKKKNGQWQNSVPCDLGSFWVHFVLSILLVLTLNFELAIVYRSFAFSIVVISTIKRHASFLRKVFIFHKTSFKVKVMRKFKISSDYLLKICRSLKQSAILKIPSIVSQKNLCFLCSFYLFLTSTNKRFPFSKTKTNSF